MHVMHRAVLVAATLLVAPVLQAQTSFSIAAGATVPMGSTADNTEMGYNVIAGLGIKPPVAPLGLRFEAMLASMGVKNVNDMSNRIVAGIANGTLSGAALPNAYFIGGVGLYNTACSGSACPAGLESSNDFGVNFGAGLNIPLTGFGTFIEARLHLIMGDAETAKIIPITFGMKF